MNVDDYDVLECDTRQTALGQALRVRVHRIDKGPMGWRELCDLFNTLYPDKWACQMLPPHLKIIDQVNKYHLFVFDEYPTGLDIGARS